MAAGKKAEQEGIKLEGPSLEGRFYSPQPTLIGGVSLKKFCTIFRVKMLFLVAITEESSVRYGHK